MGFCFCLKMVSTRGKINDYNDNQSMLPTGEPMKKIVIAVLTILGAAALIKVVSDRVND